VQACRSSSCLCELVYANDICLMASSTEHLQALLNALASCRALRHMEISVPKTKVMVASSVVQTPHSFTCNGRDIQQVGVLRYLELQMHPLAMLLIPLHVPRLPALEGGGAAKACRAAVRWHSKFKLMLFQSILIPAIYPGCEVWGMHSGVGSGPDVTVANQAQSGMQKLCEKYSWIICGVNLLPAYVLTIVWSLCISFYEKNPCTFGSSLLRCRMTDFFTQSYRTIWWMVSSIVFTVLHLLLLILCTL